MHTLTNLQLKGQSVFFNPYLNFSLLSVFIFYIIFFALFYCFRELDVIYFILSYIILKYLLYFINSFSAHTKVGLYHGWSSGYHYSFLQRCWLIFFNTRGQLSHSVLEILLKIRLENFRFSTVFVTRITQTKFLVLIFVCHFG